MKPTIVGTSSGHAGHPGYSRSPASLSAFCALAAALSILGAACASAPNVRVVERESGGEQVVASADKPQDAAVAAVDGAQKYCDKKKQAAVFPDSEDLTGTKQTNSPDEILKRIPGMSKVLQSGNTPVVLAFRCR